MSDGEEERMDIQAPFALSMILCDAVHRDPGTGKAFILGCFGSIGAPGFPARHPSMSVFAELTDCRGKTPVTVRVIDVDEERVPVVEVAAEIESPDPLAIALLGLRMDGLVFPEPGEYRVQLSSAGTPLIERRLVLVQIEEPNG